MPYKRSRPSTSSLKRIIRTMSFDFGDHDSSIDSTSRSSTARRDRYITMDFPLVGQEHPTKRQEMIRNAKRMVEMVHFQSTMQERRSAAAAFAALCVHGRNAEVLSQCGVLGAVLDMVEEIDFEQQPEAGEDAHTDNLVITLQSLVHVPGMSERLQNAPHGLPCVLKLLRHCKGKTQYRAARIMQELGNVEGHREMLVQHDPLSYLLASEVLADAPPFVATFAADLINAIVCGDRQHRYVFDIARLKQIMFTENLEKRVSPYVELKLLQALAHSLHDRKSIELFLQDEPEIFHGIIKDITQEKFSTLEHLTVALRCLVTLTKDKAMTVHLLERNLLSALQIVIATDFSVTRAQTARPATAAGALALRGSRNSLGAGELSPFHPVSTATVRFEHQRALDGLLQIPRSSPRGRHLGGSAEDIAFITTKMCILVYENITSHGIPDVVDIAVQTGLFTMLLHRTKRGRTVHKRLQRLVLQLASHMIHEVKTATLSKIPDSIPIPPPDSPDRYPTCESGSMASLKSPARLVFWRPGEEIPASCFEEMVSFAHKVKSQGLPEFLVLSLEADDREVVKMAAESLYDIPFSMVADAMLNERIVALLCDLCHTHPECFKPCVGLLIQTTMEEIPALHKIIVEQGGLAALLNILQPQHPLHKYNSDVVFDTIALLATHPKFDIFATRAGVIGKIHLITKRRRAAMAEAAKRGTIDGDNELELSTYVHAQTMSDVIRRHSAAITLQTQFRRILATSRSNRKLLKQSVRDFF